MSIINTSSTANRSPSSCDCFTTTEPSGRLKAALHPSPQLSLKLPIALSPASQHYTLSPARLLMQIKTPPETDPMTPAEVCRSSLDSAADQFDVAGLMDQGHLRDSGLAACRALLDAMDPGAALTADDVDV